MLLKLQCLLSVMYLLQKYHISYGFPTRSTNKGTAIQTWKPMGAILSKPPQMQRESFPDPVILIISWSRGQEERSRRNGICKVMGHFLSESRVIFLLQISQMLEIIVRIKLEGHVGMIPLQVRMTKARDKQC